ncbi:MAG: hypothetical protein ABI689_16135 [Thermoanaerobaculia bacterium]
MPEDASRRGRFCDSCRGAAFGGRLSSFNAIERFGAYFGILGTLGLGILDLWRDPNRRLGHDRAVDTVVVRREKTARVAPGIG